jgi:Putative zinc-finger
MNHADAIQTMASERYLLNELAPEDREAFEAHFFTCAECAADLRTAAAFMQEAKAQLPKFATPYSAHPQPVTPPESRQRMLWWRPAVILPAFLALLAILGYQNLESVNAMRSESTQPLVLPRITLQAGANTGAKVPVDATQGQGVVLLIDLPQPAAAYDSYTINLQYPEAGRVWSQTVAASAADGGPSEPLPLLIPALGLEQGSYHLAVYGVRSHGHRALLNLNTLQIQFKAHRSHG